MKKIIAIAAALGLASLTSGNANVKIVNDQNENNPTDKSMKAVAGEEKKRKHKKSVLDPSPPDFRDNVNQYFADHTEPFYNPKKGERVKNKLNRKRYNPNRNKHK